MRRVKKTDLFVSLFLILAFAVICVGVFSPKKSRADEEALIFIRVEGISFAVAEQLSSERLFLLDEKYELLPVGIEGEPSRLLFTDSEGAIRELPSATKYTVTLMLRGTGVQSEAGFLLGAVRYIAPNMSLSLSAEASLVWGKITEITPIFSISDK